MNEEEEKALEMSGTSPDALTVAPEPTAEQIEEAGLAPAPETDEARETEADQEAQEAPEAPIPAQEAEEAPGVVSGQATQTFTQSQVDEIAGKTRKEAEARALRKVYARYGVDGEEALDGLFGDAQRYGTLKDRYDAEAAAWKKEAAEREETLKGLSEQVALLRSGIDESRFEDATLIMRGKGLEITPETIAAELATHPEWKPAKEAETDAHPRFAKRPDAPSWREQAPAGETQREVRLSVLGNDSTQGSQAPEMSERDIAMKKIFKL